MMEQEPMHNEDYQRLLGRLIMDEDFRYAVLGDDEGMRASALAEMKIEDQAVREEIATYLKYRREEISELLDFLHDDVAFMA